jgi:hypothetical protein
VSQWRALWADLFDDEPDPAVAASMDEIERHCAPGFDDPFLVIAMYQHRHGQILELSIGDWLEQHGEAVRSHLRAAHTGAMKLYVSAGKAAVSAQALDALGHQVVERVGQSLRTLERAEKQLRSEVTHHRSILRTIQEHISWTRPTLLVLLAAGLLASGMVNAFLARRAFSERPGELLWSQLSDAERHDLPAFIMSGALSDLMNCRVEGFRAKDGRCVLAKDPAGSAAGWALPDEVSRRVGRPWSAEQR